MIPTEHELTVAVDAAARRLLADTSRTTGTPTPRFEDLSPGVQLQWRQTVLPTVAAALEALPDRRATVVDRIEQIAEALRRWNGDDGSLVIDSIVRNTLRLAEDIRAGLP